MAAPQNDMIEWLRSIYRVSLQAMIEGNARVSTWLVVGNAGALVLVFQALVGGSWCEPSLIAPSLWLFMGGLTAAFLAVALGAAVGSALLQTLSAMIDTLWLIERNETDLAEIEAEHGPQAVDSPLPKSIAEQEAKSQTQLKKMASIQRDARRLIWLQVLSVVLFAAGVIWPAVSPDLIASCVSRPAS